MQEAAEVRRSLTVLTLVLYWEPLRVGEPLGTFMLLE